MNVFSQLSTLLQHPNNRGKELQTVFRVVTWKINQLFFKLPKVILLTDSCKIVCYPDSSYASFIVYARFPEYYEMNFIQSAVQKDWIFVDVGANIGAISLLAASQITTGKVYAFEPTPTLISKCKQNMRLNRFDKKIELLALAVSNKVGSIEFSSGAESEVNHITAKGESTADSIVVPTTTLDVFSEERKIAHIDFLKIDVEGAEMLVFQGTKKLLAAGKIGIILFELNKNSAHFGFAHHDIFSLLLKHRYSFYSFNELGHLHEVISEKFVFNKTENIIAVKKQSKYFASISRFL